MVFFFFQAEDGIRDYKVTGVQTWALPILVIDWDLEAPGIENYFKKQTDLFELRAKNPGVIDLVQSIADGKPIDWHDCLISVALPNGDTAESRAELKLISAGRNDAQYMSRVQTMDW